LGHARPASPPTPGAGIGFWIDFLDAILGKPEQVLVVEGCFPMRDHVHGLL
jgi:hypothetical protein